MQTTTKCVLPIHVASAQKKIEKTVRKSFDSGLFTKFQLPNEAWAKDVHSMVWFGGRKHDITVGHGHMCLLEARLICQGEMLVAGFPCDKLDGQTLKDKRNSVITMDPTAFTTAIKDYGFIGRVKPGELFCLPTGFMCAMTYSIDTYGLRWTFSADEADTARAVRTLKGLFDSFPEMMNESKGYIQLRHFLTTE